ncbi:hypothetical protein [Spiroplasma taiwanense]|uniref:Transmembrane protein n=1 Tax=Spiroplasma taiwanense CT-1 TaxID=1276220 RepID=S5MHH3_9MOLU|nr:hypothetical protein [Spiroplasma taiwanense]AGR41295.1 hypothetical protein STAIW_v1c06770 [Spiroplasma taiwanense CT-1]
MYFFLKQNNHNQKKIEKTFLIWFALVPILCVLLDLFFTTIQPKYGPGKDGEYTVNFDYALISQSLYLSVWSALATSAYGITNWISINYNNMPKWISGKNNLTRLVVINIVTFLIYNSQLIISSVTKNWSGMTGFDTWYNIFKSVFEHVLTPILVIVFYFIIPKGIVNNKTYFKKYSWFNILLIGTYTVYILTRAAMLINYYPDDREMGAYKPFPYPQIDPYVVGWGVFSVELIAVVFAPVGLGCGLNYLTNILYSKQILKIENYNNSKVVNSELEF